MVNTRHVRILDLFKSSHVGQLASAARFGTLIVSFATFPAAGFQDSFAIWRPTPGTTWQWQLSGALDLTLNVDVYNLDLFDTPATVVATLHARGKRVICYLSAGTWESWRPDAPQFPASIKGESNGWAGEVWLDVRQLDVLRPLMEARLDLCKTKGFDGIEPDNIDGYSNVTGFPLTYADQLAYNRSIADAAHARGLSIGFKNDLAQVADLVDHFDWALNEECFRYQECGLLAPFIDKGKAVFHVEYDLSADKFCAETQRAGFSSMVKRRQLDAFRIAC